MTMLIRKEPSVKKLATLFNDAESSDTDDEAQAAIQPMHPEKTKLEDVFCSLPTAAEIPNMIGWKAQDVIEIPEKMDAKRMEHAIRLREKIRVGHIDIVVARLTDFPFRNIPPPRSSLSQIFRVPKGYYRLIVRNYTE